MRSRPPGGGALWGRGSSRQINAAGTRPWANWVRLDRDHHGKIIAVGQPEGVRLADRCCADRNELIATAQIGSIRARHDLDLLFSSFLTGQASAY
jgi:hypothetical protein